MTENVGYASMQVIPSFRGFEAAARRELGGKLDGVGREAGESMGSEASEGFGQRISGMSRYAKAAAIGVGVALGAGAVGVARWGIGIAAANEQAQISFETMLGSATTARSFLDDLRDFASKTPFEFPELQTAASSLISAGIEADKVIPIMTTLGDVTAGMGTGSEGIQRATVALQQMQAAGKITGEDLNQLRDAGIPVYDLLASSTGKAKTEVTALAQAGKLGKADLDALMKGLETGKGLERFSGLMDKQSQSLTGLFSSAKDNLGQGLATAMQPAVDLLKGGLPAATSLATDGMKLFGDGIAQAIEYGQDFAAWVAPIARDVGGHLSPILEDLGEIAGKTVPNAFKLAGGAIVGVQEVLNPLLDLVADGTGFISDHADIVLVAVGAYGAWKAVDIGSDFLSSTKVQAATDALKGFVTSTHAISATDGIPMAQAAVQNFATMTVSNTAVAGGALAGLAGGAALAFSSIERSADNGRRAADKFVSSLHIDKDNTESMRLGLVEISDEVERLASEAGKSSSTWDKIRHGFGSDRRFQQRINPFDDNTIDQAVGKMKELNQASYELAGELGKLYGAGKLLGVSAGEVDNWRAKLDLDPQTMSVQDMADAIDEARSAALNGTPETDKLREAYKQLSDETSTSTDRIDAWKDALDSALGNPMSLFDATTRYAEGMAALQGQLTNGAWGQFGTDTEQGRANRDSLASEVKAVQDLAGAYADMGNMTKAAEALRTGRTEIINAGKAAGISETQIGDYLDSLGLTEKTWKAQVDLNGADGAKNQMDTLNGLLANFDGKHAQAYIDLALNAPWLKNTDWWDALVTSGVEPWFLGGGGADAAPSNSKTGTNPPAPGEDQRGGATRGGLRRSNSRNMRGDTTIIAKGTTTADVNRDLAWADR